MCIIYNMLLFVVVGFFNINVNYKINIYDYFVDLIGNVFVYKKYFVVYKVCWIKDG